MPTKVRASRVRLTDKPSLWNADKRLLPVHLRGGDNTRRIEYLKRALNSAINVCLTDREREQLLLYYEDGLTKTQIGRRYGVSASAVCKSLKAAEAAIRDYAELYMQIFELVERDYAIDNDLME